MSEAALQRAEQQLRVFPGGTGELLQKSGVLLAARGIAPVELRRAELLAVRLPQRLGKALHAQRLHPFGAGLSPCHQKMYRRQPPRGAALFLRQLQKCPAHAAARCAGKGPVCRRGAQLRRIQLLRRAFIKNRDVAPVQTLARRRRGGLGCLRGLRRHDAAPDALLLFGVDWLCQNTPSFRPSYAAAGELCLHSIIFPYPP